MRILLVSQMYPGADAPGLGSFVATLERELEARGHDLARAVVDRRGGRSRHARLAVDVVQTARRFRPEVVYAHFLVPAGLFAAVGGRAPLVVTAHGQDVENARTNRAAREATRLTIRRSYAVVAVSTWLLDRLVAAYRKPGPKSAVIDCGVDLDRFAVRDPDDARLEVGGLRRGQASSASARSATGRTCWAWRGRSRIEAKEASPSSATAPCARHSRAVRDPRRRPRQPRSVAAWIAAADVVCQPSLVEPFGLARSKVLPRELGRRDPCRRPARVRHAGMRGPGRPVRRRRTGRRARRGGAPAPAEPCRPAPPPRPTMSSGRWSGWSRFCCELELLEVGEPGSTSGRTASSSPASRAASSAAQVALPNLLECHALLEALVPGDENALNPGTGFVRGGHDG